MPYKRLVRRKRTYTGKRKAIGKKRMYKAIRKSKIEHSRFAKYDA